MDELKQMLRNILTQELSGKLWAGDIKKLIRKVNSAVDYCDE